LLSVTPRFFSKRYAAAALLDVFERLACG